MGRAPLALVAFFLDKPFAAFKAAADEFRVRFREAVNEHKPSNQPFSDVLDVVVQSVTASLALAFFPGVSVTLNIMKALLQLSLKLAKVGDSKALMQKWADVVRAAFRLGTVIVFGILIAAACGLYAYLLFPRIPQSLGGGRPMSVKLLVSVEALPRVPEFDKWVGRTPHQASGEPASKETVLVPVTLYFRTEHELIVLKGDSDPVVSISDHAVDGIIFP